MSDKQEYKFDNGTLVKHFVYAVNARNVTTLIHYTVIKNGVESKKYYQLKSAMNYLDKKEVQA